MNTSACTRTYTVHAHFLNFETRPLLLGVCQDFLFGKSALCWPALGADRCENQTSRGKSRKISRCRVFGLSKACSNLIGGLCDPNRVREHILHGSRKVVNKGNVDGDYLTFNVIVIKETKALQIPEVFAQSATTVEAEFEIGKQYHFFMENHVTLCVPLEDGMDVYCSTQDQDAFYNRAAISTLAESHFCLRSGWLQPLIASSRTL